MLRKKKILIRSVFYATLLITLIIFTIITAYSFFQSGYWYSFDNDEISHTQKAYLLLQGYIPYKQFFSIYTPVFHWFISPFVLLSGYKLETLHVLRIVMIALFIIRTACTYIVVRKIFGKLPALFFVSLTFLDPLTAMAGMQIRPDNLMLAFLAAGMAALTIALQNSAKGWFMLTTGILCSLAFLTQLKALPTLFIIALITTIFLVKQKKSKLIVYALTGFIIPVIPYSLYFLLTGSFLTMVQEITFDSYQLVQSMYNPFGFFYQPNNAYAFGVEGKPLTWIYIWVLPLLAAAGSYAILTAIRIRNSFTSQDVIKIILVMSLWIHWLSNFFVSSAFIQYYLPFTWLMPVATGYLLYEIMFFQCHKGIQRNIAMSLCLLLFAIISISAIKGHLAHAQLSYLFAYRTKSIQEVWNNTPPDSIVFSDVLFRKSAYPMIYGYGMDISKYPQSIQEKMPPLVLSLEKQHVEYILIANPDAYNFLDPTFSSYVNKNFEKIPGKDIYRRKKTG